MKCWIIFNSGRISGSRVEERDEVPGLETYASEREALEHLIFNLKAEHMENRLYIDHLERRLKELKDERL